MQNYEDPPPPYPGHLQNAAAPEFITKDGYQSVPISEAPANTPGFNNQSIPPQASAAFMNATPAVIPAHLGHVGRRPAYCVCPRCHQQIVTRTDTEPGAFTYLMCILVCLFCAPCCFIPFCIESCQDVAHTCPQCATDVARYRIL